ncbi:unnamed protein product [Didymodactylos carnosus]|uniref:EF-hand domain-containing protein n=1 Tax=Didymodactylos carnosus TaxID=1234261 RepID=A0A815AKG8_9BILA|nr:unnamed protein product [Didymodactylos carnosus]CAF1257942.1 unnamed protein product [Didymodactylos carnosus]CAF3830912.1 unnamed protein product [Didymodactylos carnosus]CAF4032761.1 unnamed protein product [Didymodactylos carnosus]
MGNRQKGHSTPAWELDAISNLVGIPRNQLDRIYRDFKRVSKDYLLNKYEFRRIYKDMLKYSPSNDNRSDNRMNNAFADKIFNTFDQDRSGRLTFDEFISAYVMLQNKINPQTRLNFVLDHYSHNNGYITPNMGRRLVQDMSNLYNINTDPMQVWRSLETNDMINGRIPQEAFVNYFLQHPAYSAALYNGIQVPLPPPSPIL